MQSTHFESLSSFVLRKMIKSLLISFLLLNTALSYVSYVSKPSKKAFQNRNLKYHIKMSSIGDKIGNAFKSMFSSIDSQPSTSSKKASESIEAYEKEINEAKAILLRASNREIDVSESDIIVKALQDLEVLMRKRNKADGGKTADSTLENLNGAWQLVFTTGTIDTQKKTGRINYFPVKAVQTFDTTNMKITNGIYLNDFTVFQFFGPFEFNKNLRKVIFDFDEIAVFGLKFQLPKGGAAKIGSSTGLGSDSNIELEKQGKKPFFNWISADSIIATARGGGGGLALWKRNKEIELKLQL